MQDLFGQEVVVHQGVPLSSQIFSDDESQKIMEGLILDGFLLKQMAESLAKLRKIKGKGKINAARREGWEELMWVYDLYHSPAAVTFDLACEMAGADSDTIRAAISDEYAGEIKLMFSTIVARHPGERDHLIRKLRHFIDISQEMH